MNLYLFWEKVMILQRNSKNTRNPMRQGCIKHVTARRTCRGHSVLLLYTSWSLCSSYEHHGWVGKRRWSFNVVYVSNWTSFTCWLCFPDDMNISCSFTRHTSLCFSCFINSIVSSALLNARSHSRSAEYASAEAHEPQAGHELLHLRGARGGAMCGHSHIWQVVPNRGRRHFEWSV